MEHKWEDFLLVHDDASPLWAPARKFASQFLLEHDAWCWVKRQNFCQEVAPSASDVFHYYENKVLDAVPSGEPRRRTVNKWATRWRARWGVRRASLRSADAVDANILREKAGNGQKIGSQFLDRCPASKIGPLQIGGLLFRPESGPLFRPQKPSTESVFVAISFNVFQTHGNFFCVARLKAFWKSIAYVTDKFSHRELVWINFDESSVLCCPPCPKGCIVKDWQTYPVPGGP